MSLIRCSECAKQVSSKAESCPQCGCPLRSKPDVVSGRKIVTIEKTSKQFKTDLIIGHLISWPSVGVVIWGASEGRTDLVGYGILGTLFGFLVLGLTKLSIWWHHG